MFSNIQPGQSYSLYIKAVDTESGSVVRSPDFAVTIPAGDYALTTPANEYALQYTCNLLTHTGADSLFLTIYDVIDFQPE